MTGFAKALEKDLRAALEPPLNKAKALNPLIMVPVSDIEPSARTAMQFARLLNEARAIITKEVSLCAECLGTGTIKFNVPNRSLKPGDKCPDCLPVREFLDRCREQLGPIIEAKT